MTARLQLYKGRRPCRESFTNATLNLPKIVTPFIY